MLRYLRSFLPWITFAVIATQFDWRYGVLVGFVLGAALVAWLRNAGRQWDALVIEASAAVFFAVLTVYAFVDADSPVRPYAPALSLGWLALTVWGSLVVRRPFTLGIAREMVPETVWQSPLFYRTNVVITAVWAASFTASAVALAVLLRYAPDATVAVITVKVVGFTVPAVFTKRYSTIVRARAVAALAAEARQEEQRVSVGGSARSTR